MPARRVHHEPVPRVCPVCGASYEAHPIRLRHNRETTCSRACSYAARRPATPRVASACVACGAPIERTAWRAARPRHASVCSRACHYAARRAGLIRREVRRPYARGRRHASWFGATRYRGRDWPAQRAAARRRDGDACRSCGVTRAELGRSLDVHHVIPFRRFAGDWRAANDLANLLTLCPTCHAKADAVARAEEKSCPRSE